MLIYVIARSPGLAIGFLAVASGDVAFLVKRIVSIGLEGFNVNPLLADCAHEDPKRGRACHRTPPIPIR
jgi:hypothetical protein